MIQRMTALVLGIITLSILLLSRPAYAETWTRIVTSTDGVQEQYVDIDSIQTKNSHVRLKTYWLDVTQPEDVTYAVTEYDCDRQLYRDIEVNGKPHPTDWYTLEGDPLNQAVMEYSCSKQYK